MTDELRAAAEMLVASSFQDGIDQNGNDIIRVWKNHRDRLKDALAAPPDVERVSGEAINTQEQADAETWRDRFYRQQLYIAEWTDATECHTPNEAANYISAIRSERNNRQQKLESTQTELVNVRNDRDAIRARLRKTCQTLVSAVGADGPFDADEAAEKLIAKLATLTDERDQLRRELAAAKGEISAAPPDVDGIDWEARYQSDRRAWLDLHRETIVERDDWKAKAEATFDSLPGHVIDLFIIEMRKELGLSEIFLLLPEHRVRELKEIMREIIRMRDERDQLRSELPATYYADLPDSERLKMLVQDWRVLTEANQRLEAENERLKQYEVQYHKAMECVDRVFQEDSKREPPLLPDFLTLGESKFEGVVKLARAYKEAVAEYDQLRGENERLTAIARDIDKMLGERDIFLQENERLKRELAEAKDANLELLRVDSDPEAYWKAEWSRVRKSEALLRSQLAAAKAREFGYGQGELDEDLAGCLRKSVDRLSKELAAAKGEREDDGEAVTEDWANTLSTRQVCSDDDSVWVIGLAGVGHAVLLIHRVNEFGNFWALYMAGIKLQMMVTRGDVRRLCRVLGI